MAYLPSAGDYEAALQMMGKASGIESFQRGIDQNLRRASMVQGMRLQQQQQEMLQRAAAQKEAATEAAYLESLFGGGGYEQALGGGSSDNALLQALGLGGGGGGKRRRRSGGGGAAGVSAPSYAETVQFMDEEAAAAALSRSEQLEDAQRQLVREQISQEELGRQRVGAEELEGIRALLGESGLSPGAIQETAGKYGVSGDELARALLGQLGTRADEIRPVGALDLIPESEITSPIIRVDGGGTGMSGVTIRDPEKEPLRFQNLVDVPRADIPSSTSVPFYGSQMPGEPSLRHQNVTLPTEGLAGSPELLAAVRAFSDRPEGERLAAEKSQLEQALDPYVAKKGDYMHKIAREQDVGIDELLAANREMQYPGGVARRTKTPSGKVLSGKNLVYEGETVRIPGSEAGGPVDDTGGAAGVGSLAGIDEKLRESKSSEGQLRGAIRKLQKDKSGTRIKNPFEEFGKPASYMPSIQTVSYAASMAKDGDPSLLAQMIGRAPYPSEVKQLDALVSDYQDFAGGVSAKRTEVARTRLSEAQMAQQEKQQMNAMRFYEMSHDLLSGSMKNADPQYLQFAADNVAALWTDYPEDAQKMLTKYINMGEKEQDRFIAAEKERRKRRGGGGGSRSGGKWKTGEAGVFGDMTTTSIRTALSAAEGNVLSWTKERASIRKRFGSQDPLAGGIPLNLLSNEIDALSGLRMIDGNEVQRINDSGNEFEKAQLREAQSNWTALAAEARDIEENLADAVADEKTWRSRLNTRMDLSVTPEEILSSMETRGFVGVIKDDQFPVAAWKQLQGRLLQRGYDQDAALLALEEFWERHLKGQEGFGTTFGETWGPGSEYPADGVSGGGDDDDDAIDDAIDPDYEDRYGVTVAPPEAKPARTKAKVEKTPERYDEAWKMDAYNLGWRELSGSDIPGAAGGWIGPVGGKPYGGGSGPPGKHRASDSELKRWMTEKDERRFGKPSRSRYMPYHKTDRKYEPPPESPAEPKVRKHPQWDSDEDWDHEAWKLGWRLKPGSKNTWLTPKGGKPDPSGLGIHDQGLKRWMEEGDPRRLGKDWEQVKVRLEERKPSFTRNQAGAVGGEAKTLDGVVPVGYKGKESGGKKKAGKTGKFKVSYQRGWEQRAYRLGWRKLPGDWAKDREQRWLSPPTRENPKGTPYRWSRAKTAADSDEEWGG